jgi:hypothetical protein
MFLEGGSSPLPTRQEFWKERKLCRNWVVFDFFSISRKWNFIETIDEIICGAASSRSRCAWGDGVNYVTIKSAGAVSNENPRAEGDSGALGARRVEVVR